MRGAATTIVIADDEPAARAGLRATLENAGFEICAEVGDARAAVSAALEYRPNICLLDISVPGDGFAALAEISSRVPESSTVVLTGSREEDDLFRSLKAGAVGYLLKDTDPDRLPNALRGVLAGEAALPRTLVARLIEEFRDRGQRRLRLTDATGVRLTSREWEVLELMRRGLGTPAMARWLLVSDATIRSHVASILKKLRVPNRAAAVELYRKATS